jgi:hypothetical protein
MKRIFPLWILLTIFAFAGAANALSYSIPPLPNLPNSAWDVGSSVTYRTTISEDADEITFATRFAILESVRDNATRQTLYRIEIDLVDINGLPSDLAGRLYNEYGELPQAIRLNMLIPRNDLLRILTDPSGIYKDLTEPGFIRKCYFQYNNQVPYDVDPSLIASLIVPAVAGELLGDEIPEDFVDERNLGLTFVQDTELYRTENSGGETTTDAGTFPGSRYSYTCTRDGGPSGLAFHTSELPILPLVTYMGDWMGDTAPAHVAVELVSFGTSGATTQIHGTPVVYDLNALMFGNVGTQ